MRVERYPGNPIIKPENVKPSRDDFEVIGAFNAGVVRFGKEVVLLLRIAERPLNKNQKVYLSPVFDSDNNSIRIIEFDKDNPAFDFSDSRIIKTPKGNYLTSISHLRVARSKDGINFQIEDKPSVFPSNNYEAYGIEDPSISLIDGLYYISYSAISCMGIINCLMSTKDFITFTRNGTIFHPDNKDVEIFPEKINGKYYALHRPTASFFGKPDIWIAESPDLICWGNHRYLIGTREGFWDNGRIGGSAVPFKIKEGWLEIYHGVTKENKYCLGAILLDADEPWKVIARSGKPIMEPQTDYEVNGFFRNVIFSCGVLYEDYKVKIYYGAADTSMSYAEIHLEEIVKGME